MSMPFSIPMAGAGMDRRTTSPEFKQGTVQIDTDGNSYVYVKATAAINASTVSVVTKPAFTVAGGAGSYTTGAAFANGEYGWVRLTTPPF